MQAYTVTALTKGEKVLWECFLEMLPELYNLRYNDLWKQLIKEVTGSKYKPELLPLGQPDEMSTYQLFTCSQGFSMEAMKEILVSTFEWWPRGNLIPGDAQCPWHSHSPSCLHLAPQQQCILGRLFLFVIFSLHTDILDLKRYYTNTQVIVLTATEIKVLSCRLFALNVSKLSGLHQTPPELGFLVCTRSRRDDWLVTWMPS